MRTGHSIFKLPVVRKAIFSVLISFLVTASLGQSLVPEQIRQRETAQRLAQRGYSGNIVQGIPLPAGKVITEYYHSNYWNGASILLKGREDLISYPIKYNIKDEWIEVKAANGIKVLELNNIRSLVWIDSVTSQQSYFVNGLDFIEN